VSIFEKIRYSELNGRQQEVFNFQWISGVLATYGYHTHRVPDDWEGADFIARNMVTGKQIQVQLKSRIHFARKYLGKDIWIAFRHSDRAYLYPHDLLLEEYLKINPMLTNQAWNGPDGAVHSREPTKAQLALLKDYEVGWNLA
jgi:hypothetical protein